jgi:hypothetical protein
LGSDLSLQAASLRGTPANPMPGSETEVEFDVANLGDGVVSNTVVAFYLGSPAAGGAEVGRVELATPLRAGEFIHGFFRWTVPVTNAAVTLYAVVDPDAGLEDADRLNNTLSAAFVQPDLAVQSLTWSRIAGTRLSVLARVGNEGVVSSSPSTLAFSLAGVTALHSAPVPALEPGQSTDAAFEWDVKDLQNDTQLWAVADPLEVQPDFDRGNNKAVLSVSRVIAAGQPLLGPVETLSAGAFQFKVLSEIGRDYAIQASTNLVDWQDIGTFVGTNAAMQALDPATTNFPHRFYRAVLP